MIGQTICIDHQVQFFISLQSNMFTLVQDPFYYRPTYWGRPVRQQSLFERYLDALDQRFFSVLGDETPESNPQKQTEPIQQPTDVPAQHAIQQSQKFGRETGFEGRGYIEEHREKVTGSDGEIRIVTRRRLGDRWYENEILIDKEGKKTERETWHNVGDEEIEQFKNEWSEKSNQKAVKAPEPQPQPQPEPEPEPQPSAPAPAPAQAPPADGV
jgi:hypothetical protein